MSMVDEQKLVEKRNYLWARMCELKERAESDSRRGLTAEEAEEYDRCEAELNEAKDTLDKLEIERNRDKRFDELKEHAERKASLESAHRQLKDDEKRPYATEAYKRAFLQWMRHGRDLSEDVRRVLSPGFQRLDDEERVAQTVTTTGGGYLIPEGFRAELMRAMEAFGGVRANAHVIGTDMGNSLDIPTIDDTSNTGRLLTINTAVTETAMTFGQVTLDAYKYSSDLVLVPVELMEDSAFDMGGLINSILAERLGRITETHYTTGDGSGKPHGVVENSVEGKEGVGGQTTSVTADDLMDLFHSVDPSYRDGAVFMMNDSTVAAIRKLKTGVTSDETYLWQPGLRAGMPDTLLGRTLIVNQHMADMAASAKAILFGNFNNYWIRDVRGIRFVRLEERYADLDQVGFVVFLRTDADLVGPSGTIKHFANPAS